MVISAINSVNFTGRKITKNGNEYNSTNVGKYAGMGVGAAAGATCGYLVASKSAKSYLGKKALIKGMIDGLIAASRKSTFKEALADVGINNKEFNKLVAKSIKNGIIGSATIFGGLTLLAGLGLGAIADGIINHNRAKKADKTEA